MKLKSPSAALTAICLTLAIGAPAIAAPHDPQERMERDLEEAVENLREALEELEELEDLDELRYAFRFAPRIAFESAFDERPRLGFVYSPATSDQGVKVLGVTPGGPAEEAGLLSGDLLSHVDGISLAPGSRRENVSMRLSELVGDLDDGQLVGLTVVRDGYPVELAIIARPMEFSGAGFDTEDFFELRELAEGFENFEIEGFEGLKALEALEEIDFERITIEALEGLENIGEIEFNGVSPWQMIAGQVRLAMMPIGWQGLELVEVDGELGKYFGAEEGLLVVKAPSDDDLELEGGDVIVEIGGRSPRDPAHAMRILSSYDSGDDIEITVMRDGEEEVLELEAPEGFMAFIRERD